MFSGTPLQGLQGEDEEGGFLLKFSCKMLWNPLPIFINIRSFLVPDK